MFRISLATCLLLAVFAPLAHAEWSDDAATNLVVADATGDQVQPKIAPTPDGGCYISWFDALGNGFDVRVQKLDSMGDEVFAHEGVLVADRGFSSTQDYGLDVDASGNALLVFRDDRPGDVQITAARVSPTGTLLWGTAGVQLTDTTAFVAAPKIAGTSDGEIVVAWTQDSDVRVQRLDADGMAVWGADVVLTPSVGTYSASDMHDTGAAAILSIVHVTGAFFAPKHLLAQKFDADGNALWGVDPVAVFDDGSLQFGNYPTFVTDGSGGAVFSWYDTGSLQLQCYAQHVLSDGTEAFPHNGSAASTNAAQIRVSPMAAYDPGTGATYLAWVEENSAQSQHGVDAQKFDAAGQRQWTESGAVVVPVGTDEITQVRCLAEDDGLSVFWVQAASFGQDPVRAARLAADGTFAIEPFSAASTPSDKSRLAAARGGTGYAILAWQDARTDAGDIYAQNVNPDGTLGNDTSAVADDGVVVLGRGGAWPNPMTSTTRIQYAPGRTGAGILQVYDLRGRVVRSEAVAMNADGGVVAWDGRDDAGQRLPGGVYLVRLRLGAASQLTKVTVVQ